MPYDGQIHFSSGRAQRAPLCLCLLPRSVPVLGGFARGAVLGTLQRELVAPPTVGAMVAFGAVGAVLVPALRARFARPNRRLDRLVRLVSISALETICASGLARQILPVPYRAQQAVAVLVVRVARDRHADALEIAVAAP